MITVVGFALMSATYNKSRTATADVTLYSGSAKSFLSLGGGGANDTLASNDTVTYIVAVSAADDVSCAGQIKWKKVSAGHPTITTYFYQSYDGVTYEALKKGVTRAAYTVSQAGVSVNADTSIFWSFKKDTVYFQGRYLKIMHRSNTVATAKGCLTDYIFIKRK